MHLLWYCPVDQYLEYSKIQIWALLASEKSVSFLAQSQIWEASVARPCGVHF